ncbi:MAG: 50S ribosomal protein L18 [Fimbriimonadaceae bacterium]|nr:50S ribosomal protein L18 [Fimbriimonadaceae bacterium]
MAKTTQHQARIVRHKRVRKNVVGTTERPRLAVFRSLKHISVQLIDDTNGVTICSASSLEKDLKAPGNVDGAKKVGEAIAKRAKAAGVERVVFDRGGFRYHGRVASLASGAREGGLEF